LHPRLARAHYGLASVLRCGGENEAAETHYRRTLELRPLHRNARIALFNLLNEQGRGDELVPLYETISESPDTSAEFLADLAGELTEVGRLDAAESYCRAALDKRPDHGRARRGLRLILSEQGRTDEAITLYDELLADHPDDAQLLLESAELLFSLGRLEDAETRARGALDLEATNAQTRRVLATILRATKRADEVLPLYEKLAAQVESDGRFALEYAQVLIERNRLADAQQQLRKAVSLDHELTEAQLLLGIFYLRERDALRALSHLEPAAAQAPDRSEIQYNLALAHFLLDDRDEAAIHARRAVELEPGNPDYRGLVQRLKRGSP